MSAPWPSVCQLERMGLVKCLSQPCSVFVDPSNVPGRRCLHHWREFSRSERTQRGKGRKPDDVR